MAVDYQILTGELITENSELKNQLSSALQELEGVYHMADTEPNNMKLGKMVRSYYWEHTEEEISEPPVSREQAEARLKYLKTELAHSDKWDGWSVKGMKEEKEWLENELYGEELGRQMELFQD